MASNAERLRVVYERFWEHGDWEAGRGLLSPDIEWNGLEEAGLGGTRHGIEEVNAFFREWLDAWQDYSNPFEIIEVTDDIIVVETNFLGRGKGSGLEIELELGQVWEFENGRAVRQSMYRTKEEAHRVAEGLK